MAVESGTSARGNLDAWFAEQGMTFLPNYSVRTSSTVIPFVEQGLAIGILPSLFAQSLLAQEGFFTLDTEPIPARQILLVHRGGSSLSAVPGIHTAAAKLTGSGMTENCKKRTHPPKI